VSLKDLTATDLRQIPLINPFTQEPVYVPLLQEVLPVLEPDLQILNIELKNDGNIYPGLEEVVLNMVPAKLRSRVLFSAFDYDCLARLRKLAPRARIGQLTRAFEVKEALSLHAESVHLNHIRFTPQIAQSCHAHHLKVYCYTVNDKALAARLAAQGADGIFTDDVTIFM
jgi:glycerophosphoryl diester phosphodiesterase